MKSHITIMTVVALAVSSSGTPQDREVGTTSAIPSMQGSLTTGNAGGSNLRVAQGIQPGGGGGGGVLAPQPPRPPTSAPPPPGVGGGGGYGGGYGGVAASGTSPSAGSFSTRLQSIIARASAEPGTSGPLVIRFSEIDPGAAARLQEDLEVMALILQKAAGGIAGQGPAGRVMGVDLAFTPGGESKRDVYLEGAGAVFMIKVPFPLVAPAGKSVSAEQEGAPDSDWEKAKRELHGQLPEAAVPGPAPEPYQEEKVAQLKSSLLEALKNASNIRDLKPEESVTVCVLGPAGNGPLPPRPPLLPARGVRFSADKRTELPPPAPQTESMLAVRAAKADIDSFAKGKSDLEAFRNKAKMSTY